MSLSKILQDAVHHIYVPVYREMDARLRTFTTSQFQVPFAHSIGHMSSLSTSLWNSLPIMPVFKRNLKSTVYSFLVVDTFLDSLLFGFSFFHCVSPKSPGGILVLADASFAFCKN